MKVLVWPGIARAGLMRLAHLSRPFYAFLLLCALLLSMVPSAAKAQVGVVEVMPRGNLILASLPTGTERRDRMIGSVPVTTTAKPLMDALPGVVDGNPINLSASRAAYNTIVGNEGDDPLDVWIKGSFALLKEQGEHGRFSLLTAGVDYMATSEMLIGAFVQADTMYRAISDDPGVRAGWAVGGYGTARLSDNLFLDVLAGGGSSRRLGSAGGLDPRAVDASTWILTTALIGQYTRDEWTFSPQARLRYVEDNAQDHASGATARAVLGEVVVGPGVTYKMTTDHDVVVQTGLRLDTSAPLGGDETTSVALGTLTGRIEGSLDLSLPAGASWKTNIGLGGLGTETHVFNATGRLTVPIR